MRRLALTLLALVLPLAGPVRATEPEGMLCGFSSLPEPTQDEGTVLAEVDGGPVAVADLADLVANPATVTLTCTIQVGAENMTHAGADAASVSVSGNTVAVLPPTLVSYREAPDRSFTICTQVTVTDARGDTHDFYWDGDAEEFSSSPDVYCWLLGPAEFFPQVGTISPDEVLCPVLAVGFPPQGDVYAGDIFVWDCPPYTTLRG